MSASARDMNEREEDVGDDDLEDLAAVACRAYQRAIVRALVGSLFTPDSDAMYLERRKADALAAELMRSPSVHDVWNAVVDAVVISFRDSGFTKSSHGRVGIYCNGAVIGYDENPQSAASHDKTATMLLGRVARSEEQFDVVAVYPTPERLQAIEHEGCLANDAHARRMGNAVAYEFGEGISARMNERTCEWSVYEGAHVMNECRNMSRHMAVEMANRISGERRAAAFLETHPVPT